MTVPSTLAKTVGLAFEQALHAREFDVAAASRRTNRRNWPGQPL